MRKSITKTSHTDGGHEGQNLPKPIEDELRSIGLDKDKQEKVKTLISHSSSYYSFSGPIAPPALLREYDNVIPGSAERLLSMAENQSKHRMDLESKVITQQVKESSRGQIFGLVLAALFLIACVWLALEGHDTVAGIIGGMDIVGLVAVFVIGKDKQKQDLNQKAPDNFNTPESTHRQNRRSRR